MPVQTAKADSVSTDGGEASSRRVRPAAAGSDQSSPGKQDAPGPGWFNSVSFWFMWCTLGVVLKLYFRVRIENRPRGNAAYVLTPNHISMLDPLLLGAVSRRRLRFLMTALIYRSPKMQWFYRWNRAIPVVNRGGNRDALREARAELAAGRPMCIFPEGGISRDGKLMLGNPGAFSLVSGAGVPLIPVGLCGTDKALPFGAMFPRPRKVIVRFGDPISPEELDRMGGGGRKAKLEAATLGVMREIGKLTGQVAREDVLEPKASFEDPVPH